MARPRLLFDCKYPNCKKLHCAKGYCSNHYRTQYVNRVSKPLYKIWLSMKQRCYNVNDKRYKDWGGRGIVVCSEWLNSYKAFEQDMGTRPAGHQLDRIDNDGNYEPGNCRWVTPKQQAANRRKRG